MISDNKISIEYDLETKNLLRSEICQLKFNLFESIFGTIRNLSMLQHSRFTYANFSKNFRYLTFLKVSFRSMEIFMVSLGYQINSRLSLFYIESYSFPMTCYTIFIFLAYLKNSVVSKKKSLHSDDTAPSLNSSSLFTSISQRLGQILFHSISSFKR